MLTALVFIPLLGSLITLLIPKEKTKEIKVFALLVSLIPLLLTGWMWLNFDFSAGEMQFVQKVDWIPSIGVSYHLGIDGISLSLIIVTTLVATLAILTSWSIENRVKDFFALMLLLETGLLGVFTALDYVLFYVFFELVLVPMYFLIGIWGGPRREYAAIKFFIYTMVGSVFLLIAILAMYFGSGLGTFDMLEIAKNNNFSASFQWWVFLALFFAFAIKVPVFPFHTWLPDAHVEAPTGGSMLLAGVLLKMGTYGFFRISYPTLPDAAASFSLAMAIFGVINIVYGALAAMAQKDLKKMVAYSSISHMGYVLLGLAAMTPASFNGALYMNVSHGLISPMMFFFAGSVFYERIHTRMLDEMGGLYNKLPVASIVFAFAAFANLGLPGLAGFVAEFFTLAGAFPVYSTLVVIAALGLVITAGYHLWMMQRALMGQPRHEYGTLNDMSARELWVAVPLVLLITLAGVYPNLFLNMFNPAVEQLLSMLGGM